MRPLIYLTNSAATDLAATGGKGARLARLVQHGGFRVPDGFVVTTKAFRIHTGAPALREKIGALDGMNGGDAQALAEAAAALREAITERALPEEVSDAVKEALQKNTSYAVRSSATAEDLPSASFAGQHDTHLGVRGAEAVLENVNACMASLFTDRAVAYRARNGISHADVDMAVVVQEMTHADAAGVLFTADPDTGNRTIAAIDATYGLGDLVVSGTVSADHARVNKQTGAVLDYAVGEKQTTRVLAGAGSGTAAVETSAERRKGRVLSDAQLRALARLGAEVEQLFEGVPQDIEWALTEESFAVLQSRPITTLTPPPEPQPTDGRLHVYLSVGHGQAMTAPMPPLALDLWATVYSRLMNDWTGTDFDWVTCTEGRLYFELTPMLGHRSLRRSIARSIDPVSEEAAAGARRLFEERAGDFGGDFSLSDLGPLLRKVPGALPKAAWMIGEILRETVLPFFEGEVGARRFRTWLHEWGREGAAAILAPIDPKALTENAFAGFPDDALIKEMLPKVMRVLVGPAVASILRTLLPGADAALVDRAGRGNAEEVGTRMTLDLGDLADTARRAPAVEEAVRDKRSLDAIREIDGSGPFVRQFEGFLENFGHRAAGEFDPSRPRWRDDPSEPLGIVRSILQGEKKGAHRRRLREREHKAEAAAHTLRQQARRGLLGGGRGPLVARLLRVYRAYIHLRDEPKHGVAHLLAAWHEALQRAGQHLAGARVLGAADDVWYLRKGELFALLDDPGGDVPDLEVRRAKHERQKRVEVPPLITSEGEVPRAERGNVPEDALAGTGVSPGIVEGTARIAYSPGEATLKAGDILVCPSSDPAWTPLFATAGGLVTEVGGRFTHGALVAREYGLPAVASVTGATRRIKDGQRIRVDGTKGSVEVLDADGVS